MHAPIHPARDQSSDSEREKQRREGPAQEEGSKQEGNKEGSKQAIGAMEHGYPCNGCGKEKRPPLKRGQLKLQIARTLLGSLAAPVAKNRDRGFGR
uniref:Uncharacterized protein n=2 Tax=Zea mays TaxID=4577 RepID=A0A804R0G7_MAIZE